MTLQRTGIIGPGMAVGVLALFATSGLSTANAEPAAKVTKAEEMRLEGISSVVRRQMENGIVPGALVYISQNGEQSYFRSQGLADLEGKKAVQKDTIFRFYSMSKPLTCAAVMTLYDDGLINLDDPVRKYLPEFSDMKVRTPSGIVPADRDITIRHLMTHTSGLSYEVMNSLVAGDYRKADVFAIRNRLSEDLEHHVKRVARLPLTAQPGTAWNYGESMGVLGRIVEVVSGKTYRVYLKDRLFGPLEMKDTDFFVPPEKAGRLAQLYIKGETTALRNLRDEAHYGGSYLVKPQLEYGGAGMVGTAGDYMNFAQMLLDDGAFGGRQVLSQKSVRMMLTNQLDPSLGDQPLKASGRAPGVGFGFCGFMVAAMRDQSPPGSIGEYGWGGWASTTFWVDPKRDLAGLVFTQVIPEVLGTMTLGDEVRAVVYSGQSKK